MTTSVWLTEWEKKWDFVIKINYIDNQEKKEKKIWSKESNLKPGNNETKQTKKNSIKKRRNSIPMMMMMMMTR